MQRDQGETKEEWITHHNGKKALMLSKKIPLKDEHGAITGILGISMDITEKKMRLRETKQTIRISVPLEKIPR